MHYTTDGRLTTSQIAAIGNLCLAVAAAAACTSNTASVSNDHGPYDEGKAMSHTPEPWKTIKPMHGHATKYLCVQIGEDETYTTLELKPADARRIVACVNACAGLSTEALKKGPTFSEAVGWSLVGSALLAAAKATVQYAETCGDFPEYTSGYAISMENFAALQAAIAAAESEVLP